jgi:hypothetical protein
MKSTARNPLRRIWVDEETVYRCAKHGIRRVGSPTASTSECLRSACVLEKVTLKITRIE